MTSLTREQELLVRVCRLRDDADDDAAAEALLAKPLDWNYLVVVAALHKVLQLVWHNLVRKEWVGLAVAKAGMPEMWVHYVSQFSAANRIRNEKYMALLDGLATEFESAGQCIVVVKGGALIDSLYPREARFMNDLDFLAARGDRAAVKDHLFAHGYRFGVYNHSSQAVEPLDRRIERAWMFHMHVLPSFWRTSGDPLCPYYKVQVGFDFFDPFEEFSYASDLVVAAARRKAGASPVLVPSLEDTFINLCCHIFREGVSMVYDDFNVSWQLTKLCDVMCFLDAYGSSLDRKALVERVEGAGIAKPVYYGLYYTREIYGDPLLDPWLRLFEPVDTEFLFELRDGTRRERVTRSVVERFFELRGPKDDLRGGWSTHFDKTQWSTR